jgi:hypothetical protein
MTKHILEPTRYEIEDKDGIKHVRWKGVKLAEITDDKIARILGATLNNPICCEFRLSRRKRKAVFEIYGDDVPDDFKQLLEVTKQ